MAELKTQENSASVTDFLSAIEDPRRKADALAVCQMMQDATKAPPRMWGSSIVGFGRYKYRYDSGRTGEWFLVGFSPRKRNTTLYIMPGFTTHADLMARLGKHKTGKSCLYITRLSDVDTDVLKALIVGSIAEIKARHG